MPIVASAGSGTKFAPAPAGSHASVCCDVVDLGIVETTYQGQTKRKHMVRLSWQIDEPRDDGKPFMVSKRYTLSLHEKAGLRKDLESWRGRPFTEAELKGFDLEVLIGIGCFLNVVHRVVGADTYANVAAIMKLPKGMTAPTVRDYVRVIDRKETAPPTEEDYHAAVNEAMTEDPVPF